MTKAKSKAAKRRLKRQITLAGGGVVPQPVTSGRRVDLEPQPPADLVALQARARLTGCSVEDARDILASEDMGRCIRALRADAQQRRDLLQEWQGLLTSWWNYARLCLSMTPSPQSSALPMLPEQMQTDPSLRVDLRTPDERAEAARNSWFARLGALMALPIEERHALRGHLQGYGGNLWDADNRTPTRAGCLAVKGLAMMCEKKMM